MRTAFLFVVGVLALLALARLGQALTRWDGVDFDVYRRAAQSLLADGNPYAYEGDSGLETYRYAPWFAALWIPIAYLPREAVLTGWSVLLVGVTIAITVALVRSGGESAIPVALLLGALLISTSSSGNVQPLMVAGLYFGLHRRSGPVWVGLAASLKIVPILYVIPWFARGEWRKGLQATVVAGLLWAPVLLFELPAAATDPGVAPIPLLVYIPVAVLGIATAVVLGRSRFAWLATGLAAVLAIPRLLPVDWSILLPAARGEPGRSAR